MEETLLEKTLTRLVEKVDHRYYGKYRGIVVDNQDPEKLGRLKVNVPSILGNDVVTGWAMPCLPYGGAKNQSFFFIPEEGSGVWIEFEAGDLEFPIWVGTYWAKPGGDSEIPQEAQLSPPTNKVIKTPSGHMIELDDTSGSQKIKITDKAGNTIFLDSSNNKLTITQGSTPVNSITMDKNGITIQDVHLNKIIMGPSGITIQDATGTLGKIAVSSSGVTLGLGIGGNIACVGTNMVTTILGPQPILPGINISNKA